MEKKDRKNEEFGLCVARVESLRRLCDLMDGISQISNIACSYTRHTVVHAHILLAKSTLSGVHVEEKKIGGRTHYLMRPLRVM